MDSQLDLRLLKCLQILVAEAHVTRAAERLEMTQPAMSMALGRLRKLLGDPILVRTSTGMMPTPHAIEIASAVQSGLATIEQAIRKGGSFDPAQAVMNFNFALTETMTYLLLSRFVAQIRKEAPTVTIGAHNTAINHINEELESGNVDIVIAFLRSPPLGMHAAPLLQQDLRVVAAKNHPDIHGSVSPQQFLRNPHCYYMLDSHTISTIETYVDEAIVRMGGRRHIAVRSSSVFSSMAVVAQSDLIATIPELIAHDFGAKLDLQVLPHPIKLRKVEVVMYWHPRSHKSAAHRWVRNRLRELTKLID